MDYYTIEVYADESREQVLLRWSPLRMQTERPVVDGVKRRTGAWPTSSRRRPAPGLSPTTSAC